MSIHEPVVTECKILKCRKLVIHNGVEVCSCYVNPAQWWRKDNKNFSKCPIPIIPIEAREAVGLNPLKASKRKMKGGLELGYKLRKYKRGSGKRGRYVEGRE